AAARFATADMDGNRADLEIVGNGTLSLLQNISSTGDPMFKFMASATYGAGGPALVAPLSIAGRPSSCVFCVDRTTSGSHVYWYAGTFSPLDGGLLGSAGTNPSSLTPWRTGQAIAVGVAGSGDGTGGVVTYEPDLPTGVVQIPGFSQSVTAIVA